MAELSRNGKYVSLEDVRVWLDRESGEVSVSSSDTDLRGPVRLTARPGTSAASVLTELLADHGLTSPSPEGVRSGPRTILVAGRHPGGTLDLAHSIALSIMKRDPDRQQSGHQTVVHLVEVGVGGYAGRVGLSTSSTTGPFLRRVSTGHLDEVDERDGLSRAMTVERSGLVVLAAEEGVDPSDGYLGPRTRDAAVERLVRRLERLPGYLVVSASYTEVPEVAARLAARAEHVVTVASLATGDRRGLGSSPADFDASVRDAATFLSEVGVVDYRPTRVTNVLVGIVGTTDDARARVVETGYFGRFASRLVVADLVIDPIGSSSTRVDRSVTESILDEVGVPRSRAETPGSGRGEGTRVLLVASSATRGASRLAADVAAAIAFGTRSGRTVPPVYLFTADPDGSGDDTPPASFEEVVPDGDGVRRVRPLSGAALREAVRWARGSGGYVVVDASLPTPSSVDPELAAIVDHVVTTGPAPLDDPEALDLSLHHLVVIGRSLGLGVRDGSFATVVLETSGSAPESGLDRDLATVRARHLSDELVGEVVVTPPLPAVTDERHAAVAARVLDALGVRLIERAPAARTPKSGRARR